MISPPVGAFLQGHGALCQTRAVRIMKVHVCELGLIWSPRSCVQHHSDQPPLGPGGTECSVAISEEMHINQVVRPGVEPDKETRPQSIRCWFALMKPLLELHLTPPPAPLYIFINMYMGAPKRLSDTD